MNPYREPGDRSCVVELIEDVLEEQLRRVAAKGHRSATISFPDQMAADIWCVNRIIGPRLELVSVYAPMDRLLPIQYLTVRGEGGVECELEYKPRYRVGRRTEMLRAMCDFILEKLPE